jgi:hypothetical protein
MPQTEKEKPIMATDYTEKITGIEEQIERLKNRQRELTQKHKAQERKERTRRLIERGAIAESLIDGAEEMTNDQFKASIEKALRPYPKSEVAAQTSGTADTSETDE